MDRSQGSLQRALAVLQTRWGSAAVRLGDGRPVGATVVERSTAPAVHGALALAPSPVPEEGATRPDANVVSTGFPDLDAILGPSGLPAEASAVLRGGPSSGKTTLALRVAAEAQAAGDIVAWLDLGTAFDPVEAVARGVDPRWLLVLRPADVAEGFSLAAALLTGRSVGLLVVDLPPRTRSRMEEGLRRLTAHARRVGARIVVLEPVTAPAPVHAALGRAAGLRLELERRAWLRLGRDVVGQRTAVAVAKNRYGPPGRSAELDIHYLTDGERAIAAHRFAAADPVAAMEPAPPVLRPRPVPAGRPARPVRSGGPRLVVA